MQIITPSRLQIMTRLSFSPSSSPARAVAAVAQSYVSVCPAHAVGTAAVSGTARGSGTETFDPTCPYSLQTFDQKEKLCQI